MYKQFPLPTEKSWIWFKDKNRAIEMIYVDLKELYIQVFEHIPAKSISYLI